MVSMQNQNLQRFLCNGISRRVHQPRVREHSGHVALPPFDELVRSGAAIDEQRQPSRQNDKKALYGLPFMRKHLAGLKPLKRRMFHQPGKFLTRC